MSGRYNIHAVTRLENSLEFREVFLGSYDEIPPQYRLGSVVELPGELNIQQYLHNERTLRQRTRLTPDEVPSKPKGIVFKHFDSFGEDKWFKPK